MKHDLEETETTDTFLTAEIQDEVLEASAAIEAGAYTLGACTGLSVCPG